MTALFNCRSYFSFLEGIVSPAELVSHGKQLGYSTLGLTDTRSLTGCVDFYRACRQAGIKAILGLEILYLPASHSQTNLIQAVPRDPKFRRKLVFLAKNPQGWATISHLSSVVQTSSQEEGACSFALLQQYREGVGVVEGSLDADQEDLACLQKIFGDQLWVGLSGEEHQNRQKWNRAKELHLPVVAFPEVRLFEPQQVETLRLVQAIGQNIQINQVPPLEIPPALLSMPGITELQQRFFWCPPALEGIDHLAAECEFELPVGQNCLPEIPIPAGETAATWLRKRAEGGAQRIYGSLTPPIVKRLDSELSVIEAKHFEAIFLIMEQILQYARDKGIPFSSRGSAASSLVAHCLGITSPDPLELNLYFERFLNPSRSTPPDIDTDFCSRRREEVIRYVFDTFGKEHVAVVGTINRFRPRSALHEVAKAYGLRPQLIRELVAPLPHHFRGSADEAAEDDFTLSVFDDLEKIYTGSLYQTIFRQARQLIKIPRHLSMHPGGIVIAPMPIADLVPLHRSGVEGVIITQFDLNNLEDLGLVKLDLLGVRTLSVQADVAEAIYSWRRKDFRSPVQVLEQIPAQDPETSQMLEEGKTIGCFQIESPGMRAMLRDLKARSSRDIMMALALFRPGPLKGGLKDAFVRRFKGEEAVEYLHPSLEPVLSETYGVMLYQEQVLRIAIQIAHMTPADADLLRKSMSHFDPGKQMQTLQERFIQGAYEQAHVPTEKAEEIWGMMKAFAGYGFPKAHAASYSEVAWRSAWCKTHFPAEFMAAVLANWGGYYPQRVYLSEARRLGLPVRPPHVNHSGKQFRVTYPQGNAVLYMGLDQVKGLTARTQEKIFALRPFTTMADFLTRVDPRPEEVRSLILIGAFDGIGTSQQLLEEIKTTWRSGQPSLFSATTFSEEPQGSELQERMNAQAHYLGVYVDTHPLELVVPQLEKAGVVSCGDLAAWNRSKIRVAGICQTFRRFQRTYGGKKLTFGFITLEDVEGSVQVLVPPTVYGRASSLLSGNKLLLVEGILELEGEELEPRLRAERIWSLS